MRVGFLLECGPEGAELKVLRHLVPRLRPKLDLVFRSADNKGKLFRGCRDYVAGLFDDDRCERVFVVWDLIPSDGELQDGEGRACRKKEREHILATIREADRARTVLLCISQELEAWLLCDGSAIKEVLERPTHPIRAIPDVRRPESEANPKKVLNRHFKQHRGLDYVDMVHAVKIIEKVRNLRKLENAASFVRLKHKLEAP
jgi:Domain of unknown function (DUF4276)